MVRDPDSHYIFKYGTLANITGSVVNQYLSMSLGFSQLTIGLLLIILTGCLPLTSAVESKARLHLPSST